jgi:hypothetical protein
VRFSPQNANGITYFNLGFADWNEEKKQVDDRIITNNQDREKILATVASTVLEFTRHFPDVMVYAKGSSPEGQDYTRWDLWQIGKRLSLYCMFTDFSRVNGCRLRIILTTRLFWSCVNKL